MDNKGKSVEVSDEIEIKFYLNQVNRFLDRLYQDMTDGFHIRAGGDINKELALIFFQSKERYDNLKMLLQYLIYFIKEISPNAVANKELIKPFEQFKSLIYNHVNLLLEVDVQIAIFREYMQILPLKEQNIKKMEERILHQHHKMCDLLDSAQAPSTENFIKLFDTLRQLSQYWLDLKNHQYQRVRRSDYYIFKLSDLLIEKYLNKKVNFAFI